MAASKERGPLATVVVLGAPPVLASLPLSYFLLIEGDTAYLYAGLTFVGLILASIIVSRGAAFRGGFAAAALLSVYYCGTSLFLGLLAAFVFTVAGASWTLHVKDPGFGILLPLMTVGTFALMAGLASLIVLLARLRSPRAGTER